MPGLEEHQADRVIRWSRTSGDRNGKDRPKLKVPGVFKGSATAYICFAVAAFPAIITALSL